MRASELDAGIRARYPAREESWIQPGKVEYVEIAAQDPSNRFINFLEQEGSIEQSVSNYFSDLRDTMFFVKHQDWRDENEYRWVYYDADESGTGVDGWTAPFVDIANGVVAALILGADYADAHLPVAKMFAEHTGLLGDVVRCRWDRLRLSLLPFAEDDGRWISVDDKPRSLSMRISRPQPKSAPPQV